MKANRTTHPFRASLGWACLSFAAITGATAMSAQDVRLYVVGKAVSNYQNSTAGPVQGLPDDFPWNAFVGAFGFNNTEFTAVSLTLPNASVIPFEWSAENGEWALPNDLEYRTKAELDAAFPDSATPYTFSFTPAAGSPIVAPLVLNGGMYPNAPHILNHAATQAIDHTQNHVISWNPFVGGTANDVIILEISGRTGNVFSTPFPGVAGVLEGTATSMTIPAGTLSAGRLYAMQVTFYKASDRKTTQLSNAEGLALYASTTELNIRAAGTAVGPASTGLRFSFSHARGTIVGSTSQVSFPVQTRYNLTFEAYDDAAPPAGVTFSGPAGSQFETATPSVGSFNIGPDSLGFFSPERTTAPAPAVYPPGGLYRVAYGGTNYDFNVPDPEGAARLRVALPVLNVNGANEVTSVSWSYADLAGNAAAIHPAITGGHVRVRSTTAEQSFDLLPSQTSVTLSPAIPRASFISVDLSHGDDRGNQFTSYHEIAPTGPPSIEKHPQSFTVAPGTTVIFTVSAHGAGTITYQWRKNGVDIPGANAASLSIPTAALGDAGSYSVRVSNGTPVVSNSGTLTVSPAAISFLVNLSNRGNVGTGDDIMIPGFVITGSGTKRLLIRAVGPTLGGFGVAGVLADPHLRLVSSGAEIASNDNWGASANAAEIVQISAQVGAFALPGGSADAVILVTLAPGAYTVPASGVGNTTGVALVEVYDADLVASPTARLVNISNRGFVGAGDNIMIPGFVVSGTAARTFLIRAVGPTLGNFGVPGVLSDMVVQLFKGPAELVSNDDWWNQPAGAQVATIAAQVGAFPLTAGSRDAALVITLNPGVYTVKASGAGGTTGVGLVEIYEVP